MEGVKHSLKISDPYLLWLMAYGLWLMAWDGQCVEDSEQKDELLNITNTEQKNNKSISQKVINKNVTLCLGFYVSR